MFLGLNIMKQKEGSHAAGLQSDEEQVHIGALDNLDIEAVQWASHLSVILAPALSGLDDPVHSGTLPDVMTIYPTPGNISLKTTTVDLLVALEEKSESRGFIVWGSLMSVSF